MNNVININETELNSYIYRIISVDRLKELFSTRVNVLVAPKLWDDPFENFILRSNAILPSGEQVSLDFRNNFYGQCWTTHKASDAMWRIYSHDKKTVRIRTTIRKLFESLKSVLGDWATRQCFIGRVEYLPNKKLIHFAKTVFTKKYMPDHSNFAETLFVKRPAFSHEKEIRLLYFEREYHDNPESLYRYQVNPHDLIDQIMIDPRLDRIEAAETKKDIINATSFEGSIKRSLLYAAPEKMIIPFGIEAKNLTIGPT